MELHPQLDEPVEVVPGGHGPGLAGGAAGMGVFVEKVMAAAQVAERAGEELGRLQDHLAAVLIAMTPGGLPGVIA